MASIYKIENLLRTDGTNQFQRTLPALDPASVQIEDRNLRDFLTFIYDLAEDVRYFDLQNIAVGNWKTFLGELIDPTSGTIKSLDDLEQELQRRADWPPHLTLLIAFLKLLEFVQSDLNQLTKKHLDYYYQEVLQLKTKSASPDQVHVVFELAKGIDNLLLPAGTKLDGGKDALGNALIYQTLRDIVVNKTQIAEFKSLFIDRRSAGTYFYAAPVANSEDGSGAPLIDPNLGWNPFGESQEGKGVSERTMQDTTVGFAVSSPQLILREGVRTVIVSFRLAHNEEVLPPLGLAGAFDAYFSSEEGWTKIDTVAVQVFEEITEVETNLDPITNTLVTSETFSTGTLVTAGSSSGRSNDNIIGPPSEEIRYLPGPLDGTVVNIYERQSEGNTFGPDRVEEARILSIAMIIPEEAPATANFDSELHEGNFETPYPVLRFTLKQGTNAYQNLRSYTVTSAKVDVDVEGVKDLILQNDQLLLDPNGPFQPFGAQPKRQSTLYIGSTEVFQKKLDYLQLRYTWEEPPVDLSTHYQASYIGTGGLTTPIYGSVSQSDFVFDFGYLYQKQWLPNFDREFNLFQSDTTAQKIVTFPSNVFEENTQDLNYQRTLDVADVESFSRAKTKNGFIRMVLKGVDKNSPSNTAQFSAFGQREFGSIFAKQAIALSRFAIDASGDEPPLPNEPYTPVMAEMSLSYASVQELELTGEVDRVFSIGAFGNRKIDPEKQHTLVPDLPEEAALFIGLKDLVPPQNLNLLLKLVEGSGAKDQLPEEISWQYLADNEWLTVDPLSVLIDSTNEFQRSGIVSLSLSREMTADNTLMPAGLHWLKVTVGKNAVGVNRFIEVNTQAEEASLEILPDKEDAFTEHLNTKLAPESISKLVERQGAIKKVLQPYNSFDGKANEASNNYYTRVSEYLRHKNRALTIWDYERLVLEEFSSIFKVKCLNHTNPDSLMAPGYITLIVVSDLRSSNTANPLQPRTSTVMLDKIKEFLLPFTSVFFQQNPDRLIIENPVYEQLLLDFKVAFHPGLDAGFYSNFLNEELKRFLSPWAFEEGQDIVFNGRIHKSDILAFVESRSYVDYVTNFQLYHIIDSNHNEIPNESVVDLSSSGNNLSEMTLNDDFVVGNDLELVQTVSPRSILVSFPEHRISVLEPGETVCKGITSFGIGQMVVAIDFEVDLTE